MFIVAASHILSTGENSRQIQQQFFFRQKSNKISCRNGCLGSQPCKRHSKISTISFFGKFGKFMDIDSHLEIYCFLDNGSLHGTLKLSFLCTMVPMKILSIFFLWCPFAKLSLTPSICNIVSLWSCVSVNLLTCENSIDAKVSLTDQESLGTSDANWYS